MTKISELLQELSRWQISACVEYGRIVLSGGDVNARRYYSEMFREHPKLEAHLILELARQDSTLMCQIEERAAIRWADGLPGDLFSAILCNITN